MLIFVLGACAVAPVSKPPVKDIEQAWLAHRAALSALTMWTANGRIAGRTEEQGWSASLLWAQQGDEYHISLSGPLGQGRVQLDGNAQGVALQLPDQQVISASDPADLLYQRTGWRLPVEALRFWLRGLPAPNLPFVKQLDDQGRLEILEQSGWKLDYRQYVPIYHWELPAKLTLARADLRVRFIIDEWQLPDLNSHAN